MCHKNKTAPCVYVGWFINKSVCQISLSSHFYLKGLNQLHFQGLTSMAEATNSCHLEICICSMDATNPHIHVSSRKHGVPQRPRGHHLSSRKTTITYIHSHAGIALGLLSTGTTKVIIAIMIITFISTTRQLLSFTEQPQCGRHSILYHLILSKIL